MHSKSHHNYSLAGLAIRCEFAVPELVPADWEKVEPDVEIRNSAVPKMLEGASEIDIGIQATSRQVLLTIPGVARFLVSDGRRVDVESAPGVAERDLRAYLLGSVFGAIYFQRGLFPLHAGVVLIKGCGVAFTGPSGCGKSTLTAWMHAQGYPLLCDDVCVVHNSPDRGPLAFPGFPRLKLWADALQAFEIEKHGLQRDFARAEKYHLAVAEGFCEVPVPLRHVFFLHFSDPLTGPKTESIPPAKGVSLLRDNTYRFQFISRLGLTKSHFLDCVGLARAAELHLLSRPRDHELLGQCQRLVEEAVQ